MIQDTYKDGKLFYGISNSKLRKDMLFKRWQMILEIFETHLPEILLVFEYSKIIKYNYKIVNLNFKYKFKLHYGLNLKSLETINNVEFEAIVKKFEQFCIHNKQTALEIFI